MSEMEPSESDRLTPRQFAEELDVPLPTVYRWLQEGRLPATRGSGRRLWISRADAKAFRPPVGVAPSYYSWPEVCPRSEMWFGALADYERARQARARQQIPQPSQPYW